MSEKTTRRNVLLGGAAMAGSVIGSGLLDRRRGRDVADNTAFPERVLGRTEISMPILGLGGAGQTPLSQQGREAEAIALARRAFELGIRYFDTAASYGPSEDYLGKVVPEFRDRIFLSSKSARRDRDGAWEELQRSLDRLNTDRLDLWQLHHVSTTDEIETIFSENGAIEAIEEAKAQGLIRFSGITGHHNPDILAECLRRYPFDTALIPVNAADPHHPQPFIPAFMPEARDRNVGVVAMKVPAYGKLLRPGVLDGFGEALGYSLSVPGVHCCIVAAEDIAQLEDNVRVAKNFAPLGEAEMERIAAKTAQTWEEQTFFRAWT